MNVTGKPAHTTRSENGTTRFPQQGMPWFRAFLRLRRTLREFDPKERVRTLGWLITPPNMLAVKAYSMFLRHNPNHLGEWSDMSAPAWGTQVLEREVISMMADLYGANTKKIGGYITGGGTEGNLQAAWMGKSSLLQFCSPDTLCFLYSSLTHYSVRKIASVMSIPSSVIPLNDSWGMDPDSLERIVVRLYKRGMRGFLLPLTAGYTATGTSDDQAGIIAALTRIRQRCPHARFFVWIDAAFQGMIVPFLNDRYRPFSDRTIQAYVVDMHKFAQAPYPGGLVLYRRNLTRHIRKNIDYLPENDVTISGSRPGAPAAAMWTILKTRGRNNLLRMVRTQLNNKQYFLAGLKRIVPGASVITDADALTCGIIFRPFPGHKLPESICKTYGCFAKPVPYRIGRRTVTERIYKIHFLPHVTRNTLSNFIRDLEAFAKKHGHSQ